MSAVELYEVLWFPEKPEAAGYLDLSNPSDDLAETVDLAVKSSGLNPGQLAFRYRHGWILINPMIPSRGRGGGGLARKHGHISGGVTKGQFVKEGGKTKFVPTKHSTGPTIAQQVQAAKAKKIEARMKLGLDKANKYVADKQAAKAATEKAKTDAKEASSKAGSATKVAAQSGKATDHVKAGTMHEIASNKHKAAGDAIKAGTHEAFSNYHKKKADKIAQQAEAEKKAAAEKEAKAKAEQAKAEQQKALKAFQEDHAKQAYTRASMAALKASKAAKFAPEHEQVVAHTVAAQKHSVAAEKAKALGNHPQVVSSHEYAAEKHKAKAQSLADGVKTEKAPLPKKAVAKKVAAAPPSSVAPPAKEISQSKQVELSENAVKKALSAQKAVQSGDHVKAAEDFGAAGALFTQAGYSNLAVNKFWLAQEHALKAGDLSKAADYASARAEASGYSVHHAKAATLHKRASDASNGDVFEEDYHTEKFIEHKNKAGSAYAPPAAKKTVAQKAVAPAKTAASPPKKTEYQIGNDLKQEAAMLVADGDLEGASKKFADAGYHYKLSGNKTPALDSYKKSVSYGKLANQKSISLEGVTSAASSQTQVALLTKKPEDYLEAEKMHNLASHVGVPSMQKYHQQKAAEAKAAKEAVKPLEKNKYTADLPDSLLGTNKAADAQTLKNLKAKINKTNSNAEYEALKAHYDKLSSEFFTKYGQEYDPLKVKLSSDPTDDEKKNLAIEAGKKYFPGSVTAGFPLSPVGISANEGWKPSKQENSSGYSQQSSLISYTTDSEPFNAALRNNKYSAYDEGKTDSKIAQIDQAFRDVPPLKEPMSVSRKMSSDGSTDGPFPKPPPYLEPGQEFTDTGYGSTSKDPSKWHGNIYMEIRIPAGTKAIDIEETSGSTFHGEREVLLPRNTKYKVVSDESSPAWDDPNKNVRKLVVEVVPTDEWN